MSSDNELMPSPGELITPSSDAYPIGNASTAYVEIDRQIATARMYPRNVTTFMRETKELACLDVDTAQSMFYSVPRAGKNIVGPSIRLAELCLSTWGNIRVECRVVDVTKNTVSVEAACWDLQTNAAARVPKVRKIQGRKRPDGSREAPNDDMINIATNAALSVALRDAVFRIIPKTYVNQIYKAATQVALGKDKSTKDRRNDAIEYAKKFGISEERILAACGVKGLADIGEDELIFLRGLFTAIKDGELAIEDGFPEITEPHVSPADQAKAAIEKKKVEAAKAPPAAEPAPKAPPVAKAPPKKAPAATAPKPEPTPEPDKSEVPAAEESDTTTEEDAPPAGSDQVEDPKVDESAPEDSSAPSWYESWKGLISDIKKESGWTKPFGDLAGLHNLNDEAEQAYSGELLNLLMDKLPEVLKSKSQAAIIVGTVEKSKLDAGLKARLLEKAKACQAKL